MLIHEASLFCKRTQLNNMTKYLNYISEENNSYDEYIFCIIRLL